MLQYLVALVLFAGIVAAVRFGPGPLRLRRDYFFAALILQAIVYLVVMPTADLLGADRSLVGDYLRFEILAVALFLVPAILVYRVITPRIVGPVRPLALQLDERRAVAFVAFLVVFEVVFLVVAVRSDMMFRRLGTEFIAQRQASLDPVSLLIIRSHDLISLPVLAYLWQLQVRFRQGMVASRTTRQLLFGVLVLIGSSFTLTAVLSSKGTILIALVFLFGAYYIASARRLRWALIGFALPMTLAALYLTTLVPNIRAIRDTSDSITQILNPGYAIEKAARGSSTPPPPTDAGQAKPDLPPAQQAIANYLQLEWIRRLDCVDLMQLMEPSLQRDGFEEGRAWAVPALIATTQFVAPGLSAEYKRSAKTTAKSYLIDRHTQLNLTDYYSCSMTDLFGNFGFVGFPAGAVVIALLFALLAALLAGRLPFGNRHAALLGLVLAAHLAIFEQEFISFLVGWIKYVPITVVLVLFNPVRVARPSADAGAASPSAGSATTA